MLAEYNKTQESVPAPIPRSPAQLVQAIASDNIELQQILHAMNEGVFLDQTSSGKLRETSRNARAKYRVATSRWETPTGPFAPQASEEKQKRSPRRIGVKIPPLGTTIADTDELDDLLKVYRKEIKRYPLLTPQKEIELAVQIERGDENAFAELIRSNLRLVVSIAKRYNTNSIPLIDLIQEGNIGLMHAAGTFDWRRGYKFSTHATWWIRQHIKRAIFATGRSIRLPEYIEIRRDKIRKFSGKLRQELGHEPTYEEISKETGISTEDIYEAINARKIAVHLNAPLHSWSDEEPQLETLLSVSEEDEVVEKIQREQMLEVLRRRLDKKQLFVVQYRLGLNDNESMYALEELGKKMKLSRERVRQIEQEAYAILRTPEVIASIAE